MAVEHFDVLIMGAGLSGIDAAHHLRKYCPKKSYVILDQRERIGGMPVRVNVFETPRSIIY